ncbi:ATP-NAD kinase-like domain-containing protein [Lipomyces oligophaga]|uniref:ATP-NAD kinase-like domain-containing protein n=1 Tax=Lipomyces oligophaga TaxID=45792 RepID=UPI0034CE369F
MERNILAIFADSILSTKTKDSNVILEINPIGEQILDSKFYRLTRLPTYLDPATTAITVINSVRAGKQQGAAVYAKVIQPLFAFLGVTHRYIESTSPNSISDFASRLDIAQTLVILSGDTSIHEVVNSLQITSDQDLVLAPIPTGSGNALMTSCGVESVSRALVTLLHGSLHPLNPFYVSFPEGTQEVVPPTESDPESKTIALAPGGSSSPGSFHRIYALVVVSWAIHAALVGDSDSPEYRKLGNDRFLIAAKANLARNDAWHGTITYSTTDGRKRVIEGPHSYVLTTSISSLEPGFVIAPTAEPLSGKIELVRLPYLNGDEIMRLLTLAYQQGKHVNEPEVLYDELADCKVDINEPSERLRRWCVDGRIFIVPDRTSVELHKGEPIVRGWNIQIVTPQPLE